jgi:hypothetical protein
MAVGAQDAPRYTLSDQSQLSAEVDPGLAFNSALRHHCHFSSCLLGFARKNKSNPDIASRSKALGFKRKEKVVEFQTD